MTKLHHPKNKADRLRIKAKKDKLNYQTKADRLSAVQRRYEQEALEQKEALDELRKQVLEAEAERSYN